MNIYQCEKAAREMDYARPKFIALFPSGGVVCEWLDVDMGLIKINKEGLNDGFVTTSQLDKMFPNLDVGEPFED